MIRLSEDGPGIARIDEFRVDPEWYHTAVVNDLIREVDDYCRKRGCSRSWSISTSPPTVDAQPPAPLRLSRLMA